MEQLMIQSFLLGIIVTICFGVLIKAHYKYQNGYKLRKAKQVIQIAPYLARRKVK